MHEMADAMAGIISGEEHDSAFLGEAEHHGPPDASLYISD